MIFFFKGTGSISFLLPAIEHMFGYNSTKRRQGSLVIVAEALTEDLSEAILIFDLQFMQSQIFPSSYV